MRNKNERKKDNKKSFEPAIGLPEGKEWNKDKIAVMHDFIKQKSAERSQEQRCKNELLAIQYTMQEPLPKV